jgi:hypothetical protein
MVDPYLTLRAALAADRLEDFVRQEQARGVELCRGSDFERALALFLVQLRLRDSSLPLIGYEDFRDEGSLDPPQPNRGILKRFARSERLHELAQEG